MELIEAFDPKASGLQTAWILATLGFKVTSRKGIKRDIMNTSIPLVCDALINVQQGKNIRYAANILYGISLIYKSKIMFILSDSQFIHSRLKQEFTSKATISLPVSELPEFDTSFTGVFEFVRPTKSTQLYLFDDPSFNIDIEYTLPLPEFAADVELHHFKRRKIEIQRLDEELFPNSISKINVDTQYLTQEDIDNENVISDYMDRNLNGSIEFDQSNGSESFELEYTQRTDANMASKESANVVGNMSFDFGELNNVSFDGGEEPVENIVNNISNDPNFHLSTIDRTELNESIQGQLKQASKRVWKSLVVDQADCLSLRTSEVVNFVDTYRLRMKAARLMAAPNGYFEVIEELSNFNSGKFSNFLLLLESKVNALSFQRALLREKDNEEAMLDMENTAHELGRDVEQRGLQYVAAHEVVAYDDMEYDNMGNDFFDVAPEEDDIFGLSFGDLDRSQIESAPNSGYIPWEEYADDIQTESLPSSRLTKQLVKFYNFMLSRSSTHGAKFVSSLIDLSKFAEMEVDPNETLSKTYVKIKFSDLIPNRRSCSDEDAVTKKLAANSFASVLALASRNLIGINVDPEIYLLCGESIEIFFESTSVD